MKRPLFNLITLVSLTLCAAWTVVCLRSYLVADRVHWVQPGGSFWGIATYKSDMHLQRVTFAQAPANPSMIWSGNATAFMRLSQRPPGFDCAAFDLRHRGKGPDAIVLKPSYLTLNVEEYRRFNLAWLSVDYVHPQINVRSQEPNAFSCWQLTVPSWLLFLAFGGLPGWRALRYIQQRKRSVDRSFYGQCLACGYNLTGNVSRICPECGTAILPQMPT
jgi:hypothetical protein